MSQKEGFNFACFEKFSKVGKKRYFNGEVRIGEKLYWVSIFEKVTVKGDRYLSGVLNEKSAQKEPTIKQQESQLDDWLNGEVPF